MIASPRSDIPLRAQLPPLPAERLRDVTVALEQVFAVHEEAVQEDSTSASMRAVLGKLDSKESNIGREHIPVPELTEEQVSLALSAIPSDYWTLSYWTCREAGHSAFTCPSLTLAQRIFFAYCYLSLIHI